MRYANLAGTGLVIVSEDQRTCRAAAQPGLLGALMAGDIRAAGEEMPFDPAACTAPMPFSHTFLDGSAYVNHVDLVRRARGAEMPERFWTDPLMYQGCAVFDAPTASIRADPEWGADFEAEVAVITGDVRRGADADAGAAAIRAVMLLNDISLRALIPEELAKGFGFVQSKPASSCAPVAVAPEVLPGWDGRKLHGTLRVDLDGAPFGRADAGVDMTFDFGQLIAHAARTRPLPAGSVIGSGTISNRDADGGPGRPVTEGGRGYSCIAEQRMVEVLRQGAARTQFLHPGNVVEIWMEDASGARIFGTIRQEVAQ